MAFSLIGIDQDDVLADFNRGIADHFGLTEEQREKLYNRETWDMRLILGEILNLGGPLPELDWLETLEDNVGFWENLHPHPWGKELLALVGRFGIDYRIITTPWPCPSSYYGKSLWVKTHYGASVLNRLVPTCYKADFAAPGRLLIDDSEHNVNSFIKAGGFGILFPGPHNRLKNFASNPLEYVAPELERLTKEHDQALEHNRLL